MGAIRDRSNYGRQRQSLLNLPCFIARSIKGLNAFSTNTTGKKHVLRHDSHTPGVDSAQVGVLEKTNEVSLGCLLEGKHGCALEAKVTLEILCNFPNETLEGCLSDEEIS